MTNSNNTLYTRHLPARVDMLIEATPGSLFFSAVATVLVAGTLWGIITTNWLLAWVGYMVGLSIIRYCHVRWFRDSRREPRNFERFKRGYIVGVVYAGIGWGVSGALLFAPEDVIYQSLLAFVLAGVTSASVTAYGCGYGGPVFRRVVARTAGVRPFRDRRTKSPRDGHTDMRVRPVLAAPRDIGAPSDHHRISFTLRQ